MDIRLAKKDEKDEVKRLWEHCFDSKEPYLSWFFNSKFKAENTIVISSNNRVVSALQLMPYTLVIRGRNVPVYYIAGVSTYTTQRGKGYATAIMDFAHEISKSRGKKLNILVSEIDNFYERFGYVSCYSRLDYTFDVKIFSKLIFGGEVIKATENEFSILINLYDRYMQNYNGYNKRDNSNFLYILHEYNMFNGGINIFYNKGIPIGYVVYTITGDKLNIDEAVYISDEGMNAILWCTNTMGEKVVQCTLRMPLGDDIYNKLYMNSVKIRLKPTAMTKEYGGENYATDKLYNYINLLS